MIILMNILVNVHGQTTMIILVNVHGRTGMNIMNILVNVHGRTTMTILVNVHGQTTRQSIIIGQAIARMESLLVRDQALRQRHKALIQRAAQEPMRLQS